jgi:hypothetical protein
MAKGLLDGVRKALESTTASILQPTKQSLPPGFRRISPLQFIAALGDPNAQTGKGAQDWGLWRVDPGPRGVYLLDYDKFIKAKGGRTRAGWVFNEEDFWIEEYGRIMEPPDFPMPPGRYWVTGGRQAASILTIDDSKDEWKLDGGVTLYDVTHLPCRAARYKPNQIRQGSPASMAELSDFPVQPGVTMPAFKGCTKQDYAVLFVIGVEDV